MNRFRDRNAAGSTVFVLRHMETNEYVCLRQEGVEYMAAFTDERRALDFRQQLRLLEFVDVLSIRLSHAPFDHVYLDGEMLPLSAVGSRVGI
jgi:hypothetical protein